MDRMQKIILISIISIAAISWILSKDQPDMMGAMMNYNPVAISLFTISWTIGMAAMMFPAITPMVLLYNRLIKRSDGDNDTAGKGLASSQYSIFVEPASIGLREFTVLWPNKIEDRQVRANFDNDNYKQSAYH